MDPILIDFPEQIQSERLILHAPKPGEGEEVNEAIRVSQKDLEPWLDFARDVPSIDDTEISIRKARSKFLLRQGLRFHIYHRETGDFLGVVGLNHIKWSIPKCEVYYWMDSRAGGRGYMTEAVEAVTDFAMNNLEMNRVEIRAAMKNMASRKIAEKLGYTLEGILKNEDKHADGHLMNMCVYAKIPEDHVLEDEK